ncbi:MAG: elongation factor P [Planctomycetota bacterium]|nr:MAG: elongation factor P [Planctomycetota bacterium]
MLAKDMKPGAVVVYNDAPVIIESVTVQSPSARGASTLYKFRARNIVNRQKVDITLKGTDNLPDADFRKRVVKMMYRDADDMHLMDQEDFNQYSIRLADIEEQAPYITEDLEGMYALIYQDECVGLQLPTSVTLTITECDPAVRGNSATARTKPATLETGLVVHVPEYIKPGEKIKVDTRTGEFLSRA